MATYPYIILSNSNASLVKRYKVTQMKPIMEKSDDIQRTLNGTMDKSNGVATALFQYTLRVKPAEVDSNYGTKADLETLFLLNNPNGTPSDKITLTDHLGATHVCVFIGNLSPDNLTTMLEGVNALYLINISLAQVAHL